MIESIPFLIWSAYEIKNRITCWFHFSYFIKHNGTLGHPAVSINCVCLIRIRRSQFDEGRFAKWWITECRMLIRRCLFAECRFAECWITVCRFAECLFAKRHFTECGFGECRFAEYQFAYCQLAECRLAECRFAEWRFAKCQIAECPFAECRFAEWRFAECWIPNADSMNVESPNDDPSNVKAGAKVKTSLLHRISQVYSCSHSVKACRIDLIRQGMELEYYSLFLLWGK